MNSELCEILQKCIDHKKGLMSSADPKTKNSLSYSIGSLKKAVVALKIASKVISGKQAKKDIPGIGDGIARRIDEFLSTGKLAELPANDAKGDLIKDLTSVPGIGVSKAQKLIEKYELTSLKHLRELFAKNEIKEGKYQLSHSMVVGLRYYDDLQKRIPRAEMKQIDLMISKLIPDDIRYKICGSYRRGLETSGDIDILVSHKTHTGDVVLHDMVKCLKEYLPDNFTENHTNKYMGIFRLSNKHEARHIDIRYIPPESWACAKLYFTGSAELNIKMRNKAISMNMILNEYKLARNDGKPVLCKTEKQVFQALEMEYLSPKNR